QKAAQSGLLASRPARRATWPRASALWPPRRSKTALRIQQAVAWRHHFVRAAHRSVAIAWQTATSARTEKHKRLNDWDVRHESTKGCYSLCEMVDAARSRGDGWDHTYSRALETERTLRFNRVWNSLIDHSL